MYDQNNNARNHKKHKITTKDEKMNVILLGASNSVMVNGLQKGIRLGIDELNARIERGEFLADFGQNSHENSVNFDTNSHENSMNLGENSRENSVNFSENPQEKSRILSENGDESALYKVGANESATHKENRVQNALATRERERERERRGCA